MGIIKEADLQSVCVHIVGNRNLDQPCMLSKQPLAINTPELRQILLQFFTGCFKTDSFFHFEQSMGLDLHPVFTTCKRIFESPETIYEHSVGLAKYLYEMQDHPSTNPGEMHVCYFENVVLTEGEQGVDAIGIFKTEHKETALLLQENEGDLSLDLIQVLQTNKMDKACLVLDQKAEKGFDILILDNNNKQDEAKFWKEKFLSVKKSEDSYHHTESYMKVVKHFISDKLGDAFEADKTVEIELAQKTVDYFKNNSLFDFEQFATETLADNPDLITSFRAYKNEYQQKHDLVIADEFEISETAFKKQSRFYKAVIKLDKNFHIYVHGNRELIEKGFDEEKGLYYYKTYFKEES